jgi:hypothetical protein
MPHVKQVNVTAGIPMPEVKHAHRGNPTLEAMAKMKVGESFATELQENTLRNYATRAKIRVVIAEHKGKLRVWKRAEVNGRGGHARAK